MGIPLIDKSSYLRGLLILARKNNYISNIQKTIILNAGKRLGFSSEFCEETLDTLLHNRCLSEDPVKFENFTVAQSFIADGLKLSCTGKKITKPELNWLRRSAKLNGVSMTWFEKQFMNFKFSDDFSIQTQLTLYSII
jgi:hypothetical protein